MRAALPLAVVAAAACTPAPSTPPSKVEVAPVDAGPVAPPPARDAAAAEAKPTPRAEWKDGAEVVVRGRLSKVVAQHMSAAIEGKEEHDFDLEGGGMTVIHAASLPACDGVLELRGTIVELRGPAKRPGHGPTKVDETYTEMHVDVARARCVEP